MEGTHTVRSTSRTPLSLRPPRSDPRRQAAPPIRERVKLSAAARRDSVSSSAPEEVRWSLIARVRAQIAAGMYDTDAKLDRALDALLDQAMPA